jgi:cation diffusion facilitator CzcD-associated flavoprotein CzcO
MYYYDVLIIGAGLSGIGAGAHLRMECPDKTFAILEGREAMGGTWDLFRYPGVRSDSDMFTLGYRFRPWSDPKAIADGPAILNYIRETSEEYDLDKEIRYGHQLKRAEWSSETSEWTVTAEITGSESPLQRASPSEQDASSPSKDRLKAVLKTDDEKRQTVDLTCNFLYLCTGYYDYDRGYTPEWPGFDKYRGTIVHPQKWPADLDYSGKKILVIGSGATAVTLVPAMAEIASHVTMLQRSPTYVVSMPAEDRIANILRAVLPAKAAYALTRWKNVLRQTFFYTLSRKRPETMKKIIAKGVKNEIGEDYLEKHFRPKYNPWDQRLCLVPDADLFESIRKGSSEIVTGEIDTFTEKGVRLKGGEELEADVIVTATGLNLKIMAGLELIVDGKRVKLAKRLAYKGMMYSDVPNLAQAFGYTNASWTLKCDLTSEYVCRLLKYMDANGYASCTPRISDPTVKPEPVLDFTSGYVQRALHTLPSQGSKQPWRLHQNYFKDLRLIRYGRLVDGSMEFRDRQAKHI